MKRALARRLAAVTQVLVLGLAGAVVTTVTPAAAAAAPGTVVQSTAATLPPELTSLATATRIRYVSTDPAGASIFATGLVLTPKKGRTNRTVVWAHGTTGLADKCTPSTNQEVFWPEARVAIAALLAKGWTVTAPDYPGLGTVQQHPYLVGDSEARSIIDSVKAARNLDPALTTQYAVDGHSQGGQGALFAGQIAPAYDGNLVLKSVATIAPASNLDFIAEIIPGTPGQGYLVMAMHGIKAVDPTFDPAAYLAPAARLRQGVLLTGCLYEILDAYAPLSATQLVPGGVVPEAVQAKLEQYGNPGRAPASAPILIVQGTADEAVPEFITDMLVAELGGSVEYRKLAGETHDSAVIVSAGDVASWIAARFS
jgi:pimeloyl-ACP methyl ester carboxylesterase